MTGGERRERAISLVALLVVLVLIAGLVYAWIQFGPETPEVEASPYTTAAGYFTTGQYERALETYREALDAEPDHEDAGMARYRVARCLQRMGQDAQAMRAFRAFIDRHPNHNMADRAEKELQALELKNG